MPISAFGGWAFFLLTLCPILGQYHVGRLPDLGGRFHLKVQSNRRPMKAEVCKQINQQNERRLSFVPLIDLSKEPIPADAIHTTHTLKPLTLPGCGHTFVMCNATIKAVTRGGFILPRCPVCHPEECGLAPDSQRYHHIFQIGDDMHVFLCDRCMADLNPLDLDLLSSPRIN